MTAAVKQEAGIGQNALYFDELYEGQEWNSPRRTITEADIVMFAALTGDHNPVHTDEEFAKNTVFGGRILHGSRVGSGGTRLVPQDG